MAELFLDILLDAIKDTLELVPFLFVTYLAMEALEHSTEGRAERLIRRAGTAGPAVGGLLGALPQCGFSAMAGTLYAGRLITAGTLAAVILSTSDELIPVFLASQAPLEELAKILAVKVIIGVVVGFAVDAVLRALHRTGDGHPHIRELCERAHCHCDDVTAPEARREADYRSAPGQTHGPARAHAQGPAHVHRHERSGTHRHANVRHIVEAALVHTVQVTAFIFAITLAFGLVIEGAGHDAITGALAAQPVLATFLSALVGLVPNCGASVMIAELYLEGTLAWGPMLAGLLVSGGMGLLVLFRTNADMRQNGIIAAFIYAVGVLCGLVCV